MAKLVSKTYGEALFDLAVEEKTLDVVTQEVKLVTEVFKQNEDLLRLLNHPKISKDEKLTVIENVFKGRITDTLVGFLVIVVDKGRYNEISSIFKYFLARAREYKSIGVAFVTSAVELTEAQKGSITNKLLATTKYVQFEMNYIVDKSIIGGLVVQIGDRVVDSSIQTKIKTLMKALV